MTTTAPEIISHLGKVTGPDGNGWFTALCPFHDDRRRPNLRVSDTGFQCMACGEKGSLIRLAAHLGINRAQAVDNKSPRARITATYDYRDSSGQLLFQVVRKEPKQFLQRRPDVSGGWIWDLKGVERVLYRLSDLLAAPKDALVFVVEGEKDADALVALGLTATTCPGGAGKWNNSYDSAMSDRNVVILPDNDGPGRKHAEHVASQLKYAAQTVRVVALPSLNDKGDVSDWLAQGNTAEHLSQLVEHTPFWHSPEPPGPSGLSFPRTDAGNAEMFADINADNLRYDHRRVIWLRWGGHWWEPDRDGLHVRLAKQLARERLRRAADIDDYEQRRNETKWATTSENRTRLEAALALSRNEEQLTDSGDNWDSAPMSLGVGNGVVDLRKGVLRPGRPEDRLLLHTNVVYSPNSKAPRFRLFLSEVFKGNPQLVDFVQRAIGYSLTGDTREQVIFICHGAGANGKSQLLRTLGHVLGSYAHNLPFSSLERGKQYAIPTDLADLVGKRLVTASETNEGTWLNEGRIKALTGQDSVTARFLNQDFFTFTPVAKFWLAVNHKPRVSDDSYGFWRRVRLIPFDATFVTDHEKSLTCEPDHRHADLRLNEELWAERNGILAWAIEGALMWQRDGLGTPEEIRAATEQYRIEADPLNDFFEAFCLISPDATAKADRLFREYQQWAAQEGLSQRELLTRTAFGTRLSKRFEKTKTRTGIEYHGIGLLRETYP